MIRVAPSCTPTVPIDDRPSGGPGSGVSRPAQSSVVLVVKACFVQIHVHVDDFDAELVEKPSEAGIEAEAPDCATCFSLRGEVANLFEVDQGAFGVLSAGSEVCDGVKLHSSRPSAS